MEDKRPFLDRRYIEAWIKGHGHMYKCELAWRAGITGTALSRLMSGHVKPHQSTVKRLAEAMGVDPAEIVISPEDVPPEVNREYKRRQLARKCWMRKYWEKKHGKKKNN